MDALNNAANHTLRSVKYDKETCQLQVLDQLLLPNETVYLPIRNMEQAHAVIKSMQIRGAPLIAMVAILGLCVDVHQSDSDVALSDIHAKLDYILTSRPTAVNLFNAISELKALLQNKSPAELKSTIKEYAEFMLQRDENDNRQIGKLGADAILSLPLKQPKSEQDGVTVMTICNTGSLATVVYGTALGVVRALHENRQLHKVVVLETRPYNQGSRLTSYECVVEQIPSVLITDSMASYYMKHFRVDACVVGADRVAANGDTANKIGTYNLAVAAHYHQVPLFVASPFTTLDLQIPDGSHIPIEERPPKELLESSKAPQNMPVWNPSFDVTPAALIAGIITEKGVIHNESGTLDVKRLVESNR